MCLILYTITAAILIMYQSDKTSQICFSSIRKLMPGFKLWTSVQLFIKKKKMIYELCPWISIQCRLFFSVHKRMRLKRHHTLLGQFYIIHNPALFLSK